MGASLTWPGSRGVPEPLGRGWVEVLGSAVLVRWAGFGAAMAPGHFTACLPEHLD